MKLKVGMYVRFKNNKNIQYIGKIVNINEYREPCFKYAIEVTWYDDYIFIGDNDIIGKPSFDLIDLIEVGDIIEWEFKDYGYSGINEVINRFGTIGVYPQEWDDCLELNRIVIKSVVTKEQFNACKYVVERDK